MLCQRIPIPLLCFSVLCGLTACDQNHTFSSDKSKKATAESTAASFVQRPSSAQRLEETGAEQAFMVEAPETGTDLGWGWSIDRGQTIPTQCVEYERRSDPAQETRVSVDEVRDSQELARSLDISTAVSVKAIGYSASGKAKFAKDTKISAFSTTMVIKADVRNGAEYAAPKAAIKGHTGAAVVLTDAAAALARRDLAAFQQTCGEGYVSAMMKGAEAYAVIDFKTRTEAQRESTEASVSGAGWGVKVDGAFKAAASTAKGSAKSSITYYQAGGSGNPLPSNADQIKERIEKLAEDALGAGKTYTLEITPYQVLENFPRGAELTADAGETDEIAEAWGLYRTVYDDIGTVFAAPNQFLLPVATCNEGATKPSDCMIGFKPINATDVGGGVSTLDMLGALQDVALLSLDRIELGAQKCLAAGAACNFDPAALRSSYATRAGLPMPKDWLPKRDRENPTADMRAAQLAFQLRAVARGRCSISSLAAGCISNAEIAGWAARTGFVPLATADAKAFARAVTALKGKTPFLTGDADRPDALTLWVPPAHLHAAETALAGANVVK